MPVATETEGANPWEVLGWLSAGREDALGKGGCEVAGMDFSYTLIFTRSCFLGNLFLSCLVIFSCKSGCLLLMKLGIGIAVRLKEVLLLASRLRQHFSVYFESLYGWLLYIYIYIHIYMCCKKY